MSGLFLTATADRHSSILTLKWGLGTSSGPGRLERRRLRRPLHTARTVEADANSSIAATVHIIVAVKS